MADGENLDQGTGGDANADAVAVAAKATEGGTPEEKAAEQARIAAEAAKPIEYQPFTMPEGMEGNKDGLEAFVNPLAQKLKLSQEDAQGLIESHANALKTQAEAHTKAWNTAMGKWQDDAKADPEIGGDKFKETEAHVALALKKLGPPNSKDEHGVDLGTNPLENILKITGVGHHVEIYRLLNKVGMILADDKFDLGHVLGQSTKTGAEVMYPNQGK